MAWDEATRPLQGVAKQLAIVAVVASERDGVVSAVLVRPYSGTSDNEPPQQRKPLYNEIITIV